MSINLIENIKDEDLAMSFQDYQSDSEYASELEHEWLKVEKNT